MNFSFLKDNKDNKDKADEEESFTSKFSMTMGGKSTRRQSVNEEEIKKRQQAARVEHVMGLMDDFRLQCPQTHSGNKRKRILLFFLRGFLIRFTFIVIYFALFTVQGWLWHSQRRPCRR